MRAWRAHGYGPFREVLRLDEVPDPEPPVDGVVVAVEAAGLNFPDLLAVAGQYQIKAPLPFTPGIEAAGRVVRAGAKSRHAVGDRVIVSAPWGGFAEQIGQMLATKWSLATALSLLVWFIFAPQCASTLAVIRRETGGWRWMWITFFYMLTLAYLASFATYQIAVALGAG